MASLSTKGTFLKHSWPSQRLLWGILGWRIVNFDQSCWFLAWNAPQKSLRWSAMLQNSSPGTKESLFKLLSTQIAIILKFCCIIGFLFRCIIGFLCIIGFVVLHQTNKGEEFLLTLEALYIREFKPTINTKDEYRSRELTIKV